MMMTMMINDDEDGNDEDDDDQWSMIQFQDFEAFKNIWTNAE